MGDCGSVGLCNYGLKKGRGNQVSGAARGSEVVENGPWIFWIAIVGF